MRRRENNNDGSMNRGNLALREDNQQQGEQQHADLRSSTTTIQPLLPVFSHNIDTAGANAGSDSRSSGILSGHPMASPQIILSQGQELLQQPTYSLNNNLQLQQQEVAALLQQNLLPSQDLHHQYHFAHPLLMNEEIIRQAARSLINSQQFDISSSLQHGRTTMQFLRPPAAANTAPPSGDEGISLLSTIPSSSTTSTTGRNPLANTDMIPLLVVGGGHQSESLVDQNNLMSQITSRGGQQQLAANNDPEWPITTRLLGVESQERAALAARLLAENTTIIPSHQQLLQQNQHLYFYPCSGISNPLTNLAAPDTNFNQGFDISIQPSSIIALSQERLQRTTNLDDIITRATGGIMSPPPTSSPNDNSNEMARTTSRSVQQTASSLSPRNPNSTKQEENANNTLTKTTTTSATSFTATSTTTATTTSNNKNGGKIGTSNNPFPDKLYRMLMEAEESGFDDIISFTPDGKAFRIHKPDDFVNKVIPLYFNHSKLNSFKRQLNLYGFEMKMKGEDKGNYFHENFERGKPELCKLLTRKDVKYESRFPQRMSSNPTTAPDFYSMPPVMSSAEADARSSGNNYSGGGGGGGGGGAMNPFDKKYGGRGTFN